MTLNSSSPKSPPSEPKLIANTTSINGEIVCSIEETNRIRLALGLKPLRTKKQSSTNQRSNDSKDEVQVDKKKIEKTEPFHARTVAEQSLIDTDDENDSDTNWKEKLQPGERKTLVLADNPILNDGKKKKARDVLQNPDNIKHPKDIENNLKNRVRFRKYDGTDNAEFINIQNNQDKDKETISLEPSVSVNEDDYKDSSKAFRKRKRKKKLKKRPRIENDIEMLKNTSTGHVKALRDAADSTMATQQTDDEEEDEVYKSLVRANRVATERKDNDTVDQILKVINRVNDLEEGEEKEKIVDDAARLVYDEMNQFLQRIPQNSSISSEGEQEVQQSAKIQEHDVKMEPIINEEKNDSMVVNDNDEKTEKNIPTLQQTSTMAMPTEVETSGMSGLAGTLKRMREMGQLSKKPVQYGRSKDKRFDSEDEDTNVDESSSQVKKIKLAYQDEYGNELTRKEAFRMLCHKFHGKNPGQNKREKRLKKMLENMKTSSMLDDDTPLASAKALKEETKRTGSAHVVLSGPQALIDVPTEQDKKQQTATLKQENTVEIHNKKEDNRPEKQTKVTFTIGRSSTRRSRR